MSKRILLAEESETIRKIAESLLRQNGFEVLSMASGDKALEVLKFTSPDLILLASDMKFKGDTSLFDKLQSDSKTSKLPLILLANENENENETDLPFPPEAIIQKPFNPKEFIEKVNLFSGQSSTAPLNPLAASDVEDEFLDAALGLDQLDVTDSEMMNQNMTGKIKQTPAAENMLGFEHKEDSTDVTNNSRKVESLMITDDVTNIRHSHQSQPSTPKEITGTGKLDILDDQFGIVNADLGENSETDADHDYNWFLDELANDNSDKAQHHQKQAKNQQDSQSLHFEETSSFVDPITPAQVEKKTTEPTSVDKFIDEFKKEVEKLGTDEPESVTLKEPKQKLSESGSVMQWTDSVEKITPQHIELFKKEFVRELAENLAVKIADKIDSEKLLQLLKQEIIKKSKKI